MKMALCLVPQGFPVRRGCINKVMPPEQREAVWNHLRRQIRPQPFPFLGLASNCQRGALDGWQR